MHAAAATLGYLLGSMINPLIWGVVLAVMFGYRQYPWSGQMAICLATVLAIGFVFYAPALSMLFGVLSTVAWFGIFVAGKRLVFPRP